MSADLYLSHFYARNFRSFGEVDLEFPAEPGVVLLEGPNGLGKTSWMEAVEVSLSGDVHRWRQQAEDHKSKIRSNIHRRRTAPSSCEVRLMLGEHQALWRIQGEHKHATWLCDDPDRWSLNSRNLNGFLRGTHLLPQSPSLRLLHLPARERWNQVLRVVSGYSEVDDLSLALQGAKGPLTTEITDRVEKETHAQALVEAWGRRMRVVLDRRAQAQSAGELLPPSAVHSLMDPMDVPEGGPEDHAAGARTLVTHINSRLTELRESQSSLRDQRAKLTSVADIPVRWVAERDALLRLTEQVEAREAVEVGRRELLTERKEVDQAANAKLAALNVLIAQAKKRTDELSRLVGVRDRLPGAEKVVVTAQEEQSKLLVALDEARRTRDETRSNLRLRVAYETKDSEHKERMAAYEAAQEAWRTIQTLIAKRAEPTAARAALQDTVRNTESALTLQERVLNGRKAETERARAHADEVRKAAGEVRDLVTALARHVSHESPECPLCLQKYEAGELLTRVQEAEKKQGPLVAGAESALREAEAREHEAKVKAGDARSAHDAAKSALDTNKEAIDALDAEVREQRALMPDVVAGRESQDLTRVLQLLAQERQELSTMPGRGLDASAILALKLEQAEKTLLAAEDAHSASVKATQVAASAKATLMAQRLSLQEQLGVGDNVDLDALLAEARSSQGQVEAEAQTAEVAVAAAKGLRQQAEQALVEATKQLTEARAERDQAQARREELERSWKALSLELPPAKEPLERASEQTVTQLESNEDRVAKLTKAGEGLARWLELAEVDQEAAALDTEAGGQGPEAWGEHASRLAQRHTAAEQARRRAEDVRKCVADMARAATAKREAMREDLQDRLRPVLAPMLRSLIVDPLIAGAVIELAETRRKTGVHTKVGEGSKSADLLALASEGQLSGVNLAIQLSMALAFRWSRWPAVLLDDPSQYSDVVHSTNLVETLRVLARHHGFQVFLATHERDFALYVERKFRNDGLPATRVMFRQPEDRTKGVVPRVARSG